MDKPNILFITCHDLGRHLGCSGALVDSPNLDALAAEGFRFSAAHATSPLCSPSRAALHTGLYPHQVGVNGLSHPPFNMEINRPEAHFAHMLKRAGYEHRILVGFQHLTADSESLGYSDARFRLGAAQSIAEEACTVIEKMDTERPFYLEVGFFETHRPFDWGGVCSGERPDFNPFPYLPDGEAARAEAAALGGAVKALDDGVGSILKTLDEQGMRENTWVVFVTDHGLPFPRAKGTLYDAGIETTLLMRWPRGGLTGGVEARGLVSLVDIVPTMAAALEITSQGQQLEGVNLWPWLSTGAEGDGPRSHLFGEKTFHTGYEPMRCVRTQTHKLILNFETGPAFDVPTDIIGTPTAETVLDQLSALRPTVEFYDLSEDRLERKNLAEAEEQAGDLGRMLALLAEWMRNTGDPLLDAPVRSPSLDKALMKLNPHKSG